MRFDCAMASGLGVGPTKIEPKPTTNHSKIYLGKRFAQRQLKKCVFNPFWDLILGTFGSVLVIEIEVKIKHDPGSGWGGGPSQNGLKPSEPGPRRGRGGYPPQGSGDWDMFQ